MPVLGGVVSFHMQVVQVVQVVPFPAQLAPGDPLCQPVNPIYVNVNAYVNQNTPIDLQ